MLFSCDDFVEKDIENEAISLLSPKNNLLTIQPTHTFWWDLLEGAEVYNMQIVEGTFSAVTYLVLDTTINNNKFSVTLYPGSFQWRVRGQNNGGETHYTTFNLTIDSTLDISNIHVPLSLPLDNEITNSDSITFTWQSITGADVYNIEIHDGAWGTQYSTPASMTATTYTEVLPEGIYVWAVSGFNNTTLTSTPFENPPRSLTIDTTTPGIAILNLPNHNDLLFDTLNTYTWTQDANTGGGTPTALTDKIYFYSDSGTTIIAGFPKPITSGTTQYVDSIGVDHFWKVETEDAAGNVAYMTNLRKARIQ
ncbi:MAG: hypothetical protein COB15_13715 [Flavobacteriales bacterium]|nr:MAG: hypothetical protein COB15_13715 [Flavobacteriales bacterium]